MTYSSFTEAWNRRGGAAVTWTDAGLFVFGGSSAIDGSVEREFLSDGFIAVPGAGLPEALPPAPFSSPLDLGAAAPVGSDVFLIGTACERFADPESGTCDPGRWEAAIYNVEQGEWREVVLPPELSAIDNGVVGVVGVLPGDRVVLSAGQSGWNAGGPSSAPFWVYGLATGSWEQLPAPGVRIYSSCLVGERVVLVTGTLQDLGGEAWGPSEGAGDVGYDLFVDPELWVFDTTGTGVWEPGPVAQGVTNDYFAPGLACGGDRVVMLDPDIGGEVLLADLSQDDASFTNLPDLPRRFLASSAHWTGESILLLDGERGTGWALDTGSEVWRSTEAPRGDLVVWTGESAVAIGPVSGRLDEVEIEP